MQKFGTFEILGCLEPYHNCIPMHILNPAIFMRIEKPCVTLEIQNSCVLAIVEYSELVSYLKPDTYSEPCQRFKMVCFAKTGKSYN